ncbi:MAG: GNAT family N-acetyltransferase [Firmicutes bacterium]|nr:GNAT family N-acetyltransferase [Bacillota bacterium]
MLELYKPRVEDLWFREKMLSDEETMSYNHAWGGTIPFPESEWKSWHEYWVLCDDGKRFYRYLKDADSGEFVGEIAYHFDNERMIWLADVIVIADQRGKGYGKQGLKILCELAAKNGIENLYDDIAIDNPAISLFKENGFIEEYRTDEIIMLKKELR